MGFREYVGSSDKRVHAVTAFAGVSIVLLIVGLAFRLGWWTVQSGGHHGHGHPCGSVSQDIMPLGMVFTEHCHNMESTEFIEFADDNDGSTNNCHKNGQTVLALTITAIFGLAIGVLVHVAWSVSNIIAPTCFGISATLTALAITIFITQNDCVKQFKRQGSIGHGGGLVISAAVLSFLAMITHCILNKHGHGYTRIR
eukprot:TRINITY_DN12254_c0_g1_i4.p1 TRINITY_DN12254_c0_g1~~TRINITY_DN12254_c0_g1_i4.p1  ORF type:complete len:198 (-),score=24.72 TRINITY_DN12254_c0_g1_i4:82-675(-)